MPATFSGSCDPDRGPPGGIDDGHGEDVRLRRRAHQRGRARHDGRRGGADLRPGRRTHRDRHARSGRRSARRARVRHPRRRVRRHRAADPRGQVRVVPHRGRCRNPHRRTRDRRRRRRDRRGHQARHPVRLHAAVARIRRRRRDEARLLDRARGGRDARRVGRCRRRARRAGRHAARGRSRCPSTPSSGTSRRCRPSRTPARSTDPTTTGA